MSGAFSFFGYAVLAVVFILAVGVFIYGRILVSEQTSKDAAVATAVAAIDSNTAEGFIRLHNRLLLGNSLLNQHPAFSGLFALLDKIMPSTVRFTSLHLVLNPAGDGTAKVEGAGTAKSFNALAATSQAFATDGNIKDAIFSSIKVNKDNSVGFLLEANLDPKVITFTP